MMRRDAVGIVVPRFPLAPQARSDAPIIVSDSSPRNHDVWHSRRWHRQGGRGQHPPAIRYAIPPPPAVPASTATIGLPFVLLHRSRCQYDWARRHPTEPPCPLWWRQGRAAGTARNAYRPAKPPALNTGITLRSGKGRGLDLSWAHLASVSASVSAQSGRAIRRLLSCIVRPRSKQH